MGSIRKRLYEGQVIYFVDYVAANGQRIRQTVGAGEEGKRLAKKVLAQRDAEAKLGILNLPSRQTMRFDEYAEEWLRRVRARNLAPASVEVYEGMVRHHLLPFFGGMRLGAITRRDIDRYLVEKRESGSRRGKKGSRVPLAVRTINFSLMVLKLMLKEAVEQGLLLSSPAEYVKPLRQTRDDEPLRVLQTGQVARLLDAAEEPYRTLYLVAVRTGLRRGELLALRWRDVDLRGGVLQVRRSLSRVREGNRYVLHEGATKSRHSRRMIDLSPETIQALLQYPAGDDPERDHVFPAKTGGPMDPNNLDTAFHRDLAAAGLPEVRFHDLRHTHASLLIAAGVHPKAIQARLGHASIQTTLNIYGHLMPSAFEGVGERLDQLLGEGKIKASENDRRLQLAPQGPFSARTP